jgi:hypothetical protein
MEHEVHQVARPTGHGLLDQKRAKGMRSPILSHVPQAQNAGSPVGAEGASSPGSPNGMYGGTDQTGS